MHEQLSIHENNPIIARYIDYDRFTFPWHFHSEFEIIYVTESTGQRFVADSMENFYPEDLILLGHNVPHYMKSAPEYETGNNELRVKGVIIQFEKDFMAHTIQQYADLTHVKLLLEKSRRGIHFPASGNDEITEYIKKLPLLSGLDRIINLLQLLDKMALCTDKRALGSAHFSNSLSLFTDNRMEKILSYITFHYTEAISLEKTASLVAMNTSAFCRYFKEKSGKTFMEYILELRVGYACKLLLNNLMDVSQISMECGFNTTSHFNRIFKRITKLTPSEYKKQFLK